MPRPEKMPKGLLKELHTLHHAFSFGLVVPPLDHCSQEGLRETAAEAEGYAGTKYAWRKVDTHHGSHGRRFWRRYPETHEASFQHLTVKTL